MQVIKLLTAGQVPADHPITEADKGALSVLSTLARVEAQVDAVEKQAAECQLKAKRQLSLGQRTTAASYLRSKKQLDDVLAKRVAAGEQLRSVVRALDQAKGDAEVMSAYEASTAALASALADPRLSPDRIAGTTDALADALADQKEIDDAILLGGRLATGDTDEDELEAELAALVLEDKEEREKRDRIAAEEARAKAEADKAAAVAAALAKATPATPGVATGAGAVPPTPADLPAATWESTHAVAAEREREEKARAEAERLKKDEERVAAE
jgi:charged multivesicular body protein 7